MRKHHETSKSKTHDKEINRIIKAVKARKLVGPLKTRKPLPRSVSKNRNAIVKMIEAVAVKAGLDTAKINKLLAQDQKAQRAEFDKQQAAAAKHGRTAELAFRSAMAARHQALDLLAAPSFFSFITLDKPFLIWQLPHPQTDIFRDSHIESRNSSVNVLVNQNNGSNYTQFVFFYFWENESDFPAVAHVSSSLIFNGQCSVQAAPGIFSGDSVQLQINAFMTTMRWSGWGTDPVTGKSNDQTPDPNFQPTQSKFVTFLSAHGGHIFQGPDFDPDSDPVSFVFQGFHLSHDLLAVPAKASVIFQVTWDLLYGFTSGGGNIEDNISVDFATNGRSVICPDVELRILTPLLTHTG